MSDRAAQTIAQYRQLEEEQAAELADLAERHRIARAALLARLSEVPIAADGDDPTDYIRVWQAQRIFDVSRSFLNKLAAKQLKKSGGFATRLDRGPVQFSKSRLKLYLEDHPVRRRRKK